MCCTWLAENRGHKRVANNRNLHSAHHRTTLSGYILIRNWSTIRQSEINLLKSDISYACLHNMVNFDQLAAEIYWRVWGTPQISTGFASWLRYCSDVAHRRPTKLHELYNTAPKVIRTRHFDRKFKSFLKRGTVLPTSLSSRKRTPLPIGPIRLIPYVPIGPTFVIAFEWFDTYCIYPYYPPILNRFTAWRAVINCVLLARDVDSDSEIEEQVVDQHFHQSVPVEFKQLLNGKQQRGQSCYRGIFETVFTLTYGQDFSRRLSRSYSSGRGSSGLWLTVTTMMRHIRLSE